MLKRCFDADRDVLSFLCTVEPLIPPLPADAESISAEPSQSSSSISPALAQLRKRNYVGAVLQVDKNFVIE